MDRDLEDGEQPGSIILEHELAFVEVGNRFREREAETRTLVRAAGVEPSEPSPRLIAPPRVTGMYTLDSLFALDLRAFVDSIAHLILPSLTLGIVLSGIFVRITRVNIIQAMGSDYVEAARARGIPDRNVFFRHALKNALVPVVTAMGLTFAILFSGAILTETVFSFEGMGRFVYLAIGWRDYPAIQGAVVYYGVLMVVISLAIDILNAFVDPRIRY